MSSGMKALPDGKSQKQEESDIKGGVLVRSFGEMEGSRRRSRCMGLHCRQFYSRRIKGERYVYLATQRRKMGVTLHWHMYTIGPSQSLPTT